MSALLRLTCARFDFGTSELSHVRASCMNVTKTCREQHKQTMTSVSNMCHFGRLSHLGDVGNKYPYNVLCAVPNSGCITSRRSHILAGDHARETLSTFGKTSIFSESSNFSVSFSTHILRHGIKQREEVVRYISKKEYAFPEIKESELEERCVKGSGPGGQSVQKTANCVVLKHIPTGVVVKCHAERSLEWNRKVAREKLLEQVDRKVNGENSYFYQQEKMKQELKKKKTEQSKKRHHLRKAMKKELLDSLQKKKELEDLKASDCEMNTAEEDIIGRVHLEAPSGEGDVIGKVNLEVTGREEVADGKTDSDNTANTITEDRKT